MRELIRPALLIIARTGLFFAVVTWIVSQWYVISFRGHGIGLTCKPRYWKIETGPWLQSTFRLSLHSSAFLIDGGNDSQFWMEYRWGTHPRKPEQVWYGLYLHSIAEIVWRYPPARFRLLVYHWLTVIIFALFCGVLTRVYRKRAVKDE